MIERPDAGQHPRTDLHAIKFEGRDTPIVKPKPLKHSPLFDLGGRICLRTQATLPNTHAAFWELDVEGKPLDEGGLFVAFRQNEDGSVLYTNGEPTPSWTKLDDTHGEKYPEFHEIDQ